MKKLTIVMDTYEGKTDGVLIYVKRIVPELKKYFEIKIIAPKYSDKNLFDTQTYLFPCLRVNLSSYNPAIPKKYIRNILKDSDIVFVHDLAPLGFVSSILAKRYGKRLIIFCHHDERIMVEKAFNLRNLFFIDHIVKYIYKYADLILVATGRFYKKLKRLKIPEHKIRILPFGIDTDKFRPMDKSKARSILGLPLNKKIVLYLGRISHEKNIKTIIKSYKYINNKDVIFLIVGGGKHLNFYKNFAKKISNKIYFIGQVSHEVTPLFYNAADVFVSVSFHESQSFTVMEAMACRLPVIVSFDNVPYTYLKNGYNCIFVKDLNNEKELAEKLKELLEDDVLRRNLGLNARKTMLKYSWKNHIDKLRKYLTT